MRKAAIIIGVIGSIVVMLITAVAVYALNEVTTLKNKARIAPAQKNRWPKKPINEQDDDSQTETETENNFTIEHGGGSQTEGRDEPTNPQPSIL